MHGPGNGLRCCGATSRGEFGDVHAAAQGDRIDLEGRTIRQGGRHVGRNPGYFARCRASDSNQRRAAALDAVAEIDAVETGTRCRQVHRQAGSIARNERRIRLPPIARTGKLGDLLIRCVRAPGPGLVEGFPE